MELNQEEKIYTKQLTPFYLQNVFSYEQILYGLKQFQKQETRKGNNRLSKEKLSEYGIFDPNVYKKNELLFMFKKFIKKNDFIHF